MINRDNSSEGSSEGFLGRWSRKKIDAERDAPGGPGVPGAANATDATTPDQTGLPEPSDNDAKAPAKAAPKPEFDLASLPSLDSITAATDIRAFLAPGVPKELVRAALRRAWSADPAVRDFKGLAENDWDFTDPTAMPGFGALPEGYDIKKLVAQIFGENEKPDDPDSASGGPPAPQIPRMAEENASAPSAQQQAAPLPAGEEESGSPISAPDQQVALGNIVQRDNNIAAHNSIPDDETEERKTRRPHGGALPQ
jgi:Protein of unknown function (DUF3306)